MKKEKHKLELHKYYFFFCIFLFFKFVFFIIYHVLTIHLRIYSWGYHRRTKVYFFYLCIHLQTRPYTHVFPTFRAKNYTQTKRKMSPISTQQRNAKIYYLLLYKRWTCTALMVIVRELWKCVGMMIHVHEKFNVKNTYLHQYSTLFLVRCAVMHVCTSSQLHSFYVKKNMTVYNNVTLYFVAKTATASILETGIYIVLGSCCKTHRKIGYVGCFIPTYNLGNYPHALSLSFAFLLHKYFGEVKELDLK